MSRASGCRVTDIDGNEYVDMSMGFGVHLLGYAAPCVVEAFAESVTNGVCNGLEGPSTSATTALLQELTGKERFAFFSSGTEAVMTGLRVARAATGRRTIAMFAGSYHGTFDGVLGRANPLNPNDMSLPVSPGTPQAMLDDLVVWEYGSRSALESLEKRALQLAGVVIEPARTRHLESVSAPFLRAVRRLTAVHGIPLIFDELSTGFRVHPGGVQGLFGIDADLAVYGKILGGGLPLAVLAGRAELMAWIDGQRKGACLTPQSARVVSAGTFSRQSLAMAVAEAVLKEVVRGGVATTTHLTARTTALVSSVTDALLSRRFPASVSQFGSTFMIQCTDADRLRFGLLFIALANRGVYFGEGRCSYLSLAHSDAVLHHVAAAFRAAVDEVASLAL